LLALYFSNLRRSASIFALIQDVSVLTADFLPYYLRIDPIVRVPLYNSIQYRIHPIQLIPSQKKMPNSTTSLSLKGYSRSKPSGFISFLFEPVAMRLGSSF
jgi:hypothetical protein